MSKTAKTKKSAAGKKKAGAKKAATKKAATKQAPTKKVVGKEARARKTSARKAPVKKARASKAPNKKAPAKKAAAKQALGKTGPEANGALIKDQRKKRLKVYTESLKRPVATFQAETLGKFAIDVLAFKRKVGDKTGFLLVTNGMSDHRPPRTKASEPSPQVELCWFTRDVSADKAAFLYGIATEPWRNDTPIQFGSFVSAPKPPEKGCKAKDVTFLQPITLDEQILHTDLALMVGYFELLVVHLLLPQEFARMKKSSRNFDRFLDLLDANRYPLFFDPKRASYF